MTRQVTNGGLTLQEKKTFGDEFHHMQHKFDEIISELPAYGPTLAKIKSVYESVMKSIRDFHRVHSVVQLRDSQMMVQAATMRNFKHRKQELEIKLANLRSENMRLKQSIENDRIKSEVRKQERERHKGPSRQGIRINSSKRRQLCLSSKEATDLSFLEIELERVRRELEDIRLNTEKRHLPVSRKVSLQYRLQDKDKKRDRLERENKYLGQLYLQLSFGIEAASTFYSTLQSDGCIPDGYTMVNAVLDSFNQITSEDVETAMEQFNEEDSDEENEAEFILHCCEKFHELFDNEQYEEAALFAATSPKGVLRTMETLNKFKNINISNNSNPLLQYCTALMHSADTYKPLSLEEARECVICAVECRQYDKLLHWISNDNLPLNKEIGIELYQKCQCQQKCQCVESALMIFQKLQCDMEVASCLAKLGRYNTLSTLVKEKSFDKNDIISLLYAHPRMELAYSFISSHPPLCDIFEVLFILAQSNQILECERLLKKYTNKYCISMNKLFEDAVRNPAYEEVIENLIQLLDGSHLQWMAIDLMACRVIRNAINDVVMEIQRKKTVEESQRTSSIIMDNKLDIPVEKDCTTSRSRLVRSQHIDLDDESSMTNSFLDSNTNSLSTLHDEVSSNESGLQTSEDEGTDVLSDD